MAANSWIGSGVDILGTGNGNNLGGFAFHPYRVQIEHSTDHALEEAGAFTYCVRIFSSGFSICGHYFKTLEDCLAYCKQNKIKVELKQ